jgi:hypothetical protein
MEEVYLNHHSQSSCSFVGSYQFPNTALPVPSQVSGSTRLEFVCGVYFCGPCSAAMLTAIHTLF